MEVIVRVNWRILSVRCYKFGSCLCVQRKLEFKPSQKNTEIFAEGIEPELLSYSSDSAFVNDEFIRTFSALSLK